MSSVVLESDTNLLQQTGTGPNFQGGEVDPAFVDTAIEFVRKLA
jgi:hypothetical protein